MALVNHRSASPTLRTVKVNLVQSCVDGDLAGVRRALCSGSDPNGRFRGQTPLMFAAENGHAAVCKLLIENGADVNAQDTYDRTALHFACKNLFTETATVLMEAGAQRDIPCILGGERPSDIVAARGSIELTRAVMWFGTSGSPSKQQPAITASATSASSTESAPALASTMNGSEAAANNQQAADAVDATPAAAADAPAQAAASAPRGPPAPVQDDSNRRRTPPRRVHAA